MPLNANGRPSARILVSPPMPPTWHDCSTTLIFWAVPIVWQRRSIERPPVSSSNWAETGHSEDAVLRRFTEEKADDQEWLVKGWSGLLGMARSALSRPMAVTAPSLRRRQGSPTTILYPRNDRDHEQGVRTECHPDVLTNVCHGEHRCHVLNHP